MTKTIRQQALDALALCDFRAKCVAVNAILPDAEVGAAVQLSPEVVLPGRASRPLLVSPAQVARRAIGTLEGRAALIHALAHIELNAVDLALDIVWRFADLPDLFYRNWLVVAQEEVLHFDLLHTHLESLGYTYGDFPAHNGLWDMAEQTQGDVLARLALVPRTLEARGLDASPLIRHKLKSAGDERGATIIDIILRDEIGHVATGNRWFKWLCAQRGLEPMTCYAELVSRYQAPKASGPFNLEARRAAGFDEAELAALTAGSRSA